MQYNTLREELYMPEYGRHIQRLVNYVQTVEDKEKQQQIVGEILKLMASINPNARNVADYEHKLWDHLQIMANFELDVDSPYPKPSREEIYKKPEKFDYPLRTKMKYRHYGRNVVKMINNAAEMEDDEKQEAFTEIIASFMKRTYENYHNESVNDDIIKEDLVNISEGELSLDDDQRIVVKRRRSKSNNKNHRGRKRSRGKRR